MSDQLHPGARFRVAKANRLEGYSVGDTGRVLWVTRGAGIDGASVFYVCEMAQPGTTATVLFCEGEIEYDR